MQTLLQDIRFSLRQFLKRPAFTLTAVLILAMGLGANTAIFTVANAFLIHPLPFQDPERLVSLFERDVIGTEPFNSVSPGAFFDWQRLATSFSSIGAYFAGSMNLSVPGNELGAQRVEGCACSASIFPMLGIQPALGRIFHPDEDIYAPRRFVVISYRLWQSRFGGSADVLNREVSVDGEKTTIIGVMPAGFAFPSREIDIWQPFMPYMPPDKQIRHDSHYIMVVARLKPAISVDQARAEVDGINSRYHREHPNETAAKGANVVPLRRGLLEAASFASGSDVRVPLLMLLGAVFVVLMITCVNVANLLLTRAAGRSREVAIRAAIGATRRRIARQFLTESILLSIGGAVLGLLAATSITTLLAAHAPGAAYMLPTGDLPLDRTVYIFTFAIALLTGTAAGLFPAFQSSRADLVNALRDSSRSATPGRAHGRFRDVLAAAEVALSLVLLVSAGLLIRSFARLYQVNPGLRIDHTLTMAVYFPNVGYAQATQRSIFEQELSRRMRSVPGVIDAGLVTCLPLGGHCNDNAFDIEGRTLPPGQFFDALSRAADPDYFRAAGIPIVAGRAFNPRDGIGIDEKSTKTGAMIVSQAFVRQFLADEDPIGKHIRLHEHRYEIIGVAGDVLKGLDQNPEPTFYEPLFDGRYRDETFILLHTSADPYLVFPGARAEIAKLDPDMAVYQIRTMEETVGLSAADRRFSMLLFVSFAALAVVLAAVGVYGVLAFAVSQRKGEIGIRMALGASASEVGRLILIQGMKPVFFGIGAGMIAAALAAKVLQSLLFRISPVDPLTFSLVSLLLTAVAMLACYLPAWRASRIDPTLTLRSE